MQDYFRYYSRQITACKIISDITACKIIYDITADRLQHARLFMILQQTDYSMQDYFRYYSRQITACKIIYDVTADRLQHARLSTNREIHLGVTSIGLVVLQNGIKMNTFSWAKIVKISFKRKQFFIQLRREVPPLYKARTNRIRNSGFSHSGLALRILWISLLRHPHSGSSTFVTLIRSESYDSVLGFNLGSYRACKCLWKSCVEHHTFFRLHTPRTPARKSLLTLGSKFRYSGRTEFQAVEECKRKARAERAFVRSPSKQFTRQTVPTPSDPARKARSGSGSSLRPRTDSSGYKVTSLQGTKTPKMAWAVGLALAQSVAHAVRVKAEATGV
ncbi:Tyrosine-protein phosphatase non-receptor type 4 [Chionoecetes opilio]|uniref:Tyrosine-protein phosphatase non-receptor type 4 n=1 Tax=Chionoecetes opilio TaxID=41210 RepID=A0A8J5CTC9_CHIOP|nr:Tyrosine-protein phosphatase non-receptor type 4 [Chionoecetes opilio]